MSKKLVVKLLATVMAMTMVVGSELTVFADPIHTCSREDKIEVAHSNGNGTHTIICVEGLSICDYEGDTVSCSRSLAHRQDKSTHVVVCDACGYEFGTENHVESDIYWTNEEKHSKWCDVCHDSMGDQENHTFEIAQYYYGGKPKHGDRCTVCGYLSSDTMSDHDTNGENGICSVCGYDPNYTYRGSSTSSSSSSKKEKDEKIKETSSSSSTPKVDIVEEINKALAKQLEETIKAEESIPVTSFASTTAVNAVPAEVKATATAGATYNLSQITTTQGFVAAVNKIAEANPGATSVTVYSSNPMAFSEDVLTAVANANKEFVYTFNHKGHLYKITIPAGAKIDLNGNRYAGPLYIGAQLGTSVVLK